MRTLSFGRQLGVDRVDANLAAQCVRRAPVIAREHRHPLDPEARQLAHDVGRLRAELVSDRDEPEETIIVLDEHHGRAVRLVRLDRRTEWTGLDETRLSQASRAAIDDASEPTAYDGPHVVGLVRRACRSQDRCGERVIAARLE
jgi:hypothetical protein